jgi:hypothetical protein
MGIFYCVLTAEETYTPPLLEAVGKYITAPIVLSFSLSRPLKLLRDARIKNTVSFLLLDADLIADEASEEQAMEIVEIFRERSPDGVLLEWSHYCMELSDIWVKKQIRPINLVRCIELCCTPVRFP